MQLNPYMKAYDLNVQGDAMTTSLGEQVNIFIFYGFWLEVYFKAQSMDAFIMEKYIKRGKESQLRKLIAKNAGAKPSKEDLHVSNVWKQMS